jgi:hypothetical protein
MAAHQKILAAIAVVLVAGCGGTAARAAGTTTTAPTTTTSSTTSIVTTTTVDPRIAIAAESLRLQQEQNAREAVEAQRQADERASARAAAARAQSAAEARERALAQEQYDQQVWNYNECIRTFAELTQSVGPIPYNDGSYKCFNPNTGQYEVLNPG